MKGGLLFCSRFQRIRSLSDRLHVPIPIVKHDSWQWGCGGTSSGRLNAKRRECWYPCLSALFFFSPLWVCPSSNCEISNPLELTVNTNDPGYSSFLLLTQDCFSYLRIFQGSLEI